MKKILALIIAVMMMAMAIPAMAEMVVVQDGMAPEVIAPAEGVTLTDVSERDETAELAAAFAANLNNENVIVEMFSVALANEAPVKITVKTQADSVSFTKDGAEWTALAIEKTEDIVTFEVPGSGIIAMTVAFAKGMFEEISVTEEIAVTTELVPDTFVPSVKGKAAPALKEIITITTETKTIEVEPAYLIITPLSLSAYSSDVITHEVLKWAYGNIVNDGPADIKEEINKALGETGLSYDNMIVHDLFEASLYGEQGKELKAEGAKLNFELAAGFEGGETVIVLYSTDAENWTVLPAENYKVLEGGDIALTMEELGAIAFLTPMAVEEAPDVTSPAN